MKVKIISPQYFVLITVSLLTACTRPATTTEINTNNPGSTQLEQNANEIDTIPDNASEYPVLIIPLSGPITTSDSEISGLAWYEEYLILLPQYPHRFGIGQEGAVFALPKEDLIAFLDGENPGPLTPTEIPFIAPGLKERIKGFEGFEAILFNGQKVYLTIEAKPAGMLGYLVSGTISPDMSEIKLNTAHLVEIKSQSEIPNMSDEALIIFGNRVISIHEANGLNVNPTPVANLFNLGLNPHKPLAFPNIEYRITDATSPDTLGRFWAINYYFPGDSKLRPRPDPLEELYGEGLTHSKYITVERLVEFQFGYEGIAFSGTPPIQLELIDDDNARNWEGIVRLDNRGFLLATDKFPETILGFVDISQ
ncbi:MAG: hypothetical protein KAS38_19355 [Anaerolineales bacterium]|nr:hypothetical protein [Anaerolineales bacterium]